MISIADDGWSPAIAGQPTTESLVARVASGEREAMGPLFDALGGAVYGLARRMVRDPVRAEQITRDVFVEIWREAPLRRSPETAVRPWIAAMVHRACVDVIRYRARPSAAQRVEGVGEPGKEER